MQCFARFLYRSNFLVPIIPITIFCKYVLINDKYGQRKLNFSWESFSKRKKALETSLFKIITPFFQFVQFNVQLPIRKSNYFFEGISWLASCHLSKRKSLLQKKNTFGDGLASRVNKNPFLVLVSFLGSNFNESSHLIDVKIHSSFILHFDC